MQSHIEKVLLNGQASYKVSLPVCQLQQIPCVNKSFLNNIFLIFFGKLGLNLLILQAGYLDLWEPATLTIKREGYNIKWNGGVVAASEKFSSATSV